MKTFLYFAHHFLSNKCGKINKTNTKQNIRTHTQTHKKNYIPQYSERIHFKSFRQSFRLLKERLHSIIRIKIDTTHVQYFFFFLLFIYFAIEENDF